MLTQKTTAPLRSWWGVGEGVDPLAFLLQCHCFFSNPWRYLGEVGWISNNFIFLYSLPLLGMGGIKLGDYSLTSGSVCSYLKAERFINLFCLRRIRYSTTPGCDSGLLRSLCTGRAALASCCVLRLWCQSHRACRLSSSSVPPLARFTLWSTSCAG